MKDKIAREELSALRQVIDNLQYAVKSLQEKLKRYDEMFGIEMYIPTPFNPPKKHIFKSKNVHEMSLMSNNSYYYYPEKIEQAFEVLGIEYFEEPMKKGFRKIKKEK